MVEGGWVLSDRLRLTNSEQCFFACLFRERRKAVGRVALVEAVGEDIHDFN